VISNTWCHKPFYLSKMSKAHIIMCFLTFNKQYMQSFFTSIDFNFSNPNITYY